MDRAFTDLILEWFFVDRLPKHVKHAAQRCGADRHLDGRAGIGHAHAALQAAGGAHRDRTHGGGIDMLTYLKHFRPVLADGDHQGIIDARQVAFREGRVHHDAHYLY